MANPWSAFYWRDYIGDTGHLSLEQHGAYLLLMAHYYMTGRPLPANASVLHRVCRCTTDADRSAVDQVLTEFFTLDRDVYRHGRIDRELAKAVDISEKRRAAANAKHHKGDAANAPASALRMHAQSQPQSHLQSPPPLEKQDFDFSLQKKEAKSDFSQADFDARDLRKLGDAFKEIELRRKASIGSNWSITEKQVFEWACELAGISIKRGLEVEKLGKEWPTHTELGVPV